MIDIEIDGKPLQAAQGSMIIEVADEHGIHIPRFCYHKKLSVAANCRMCLVEVEKVGKPLPACATPVTPNMKVFTQSAKAKEAQRAVMEFLLINHPLDCPICDQGGQCELQDNALSYGRDVSDYHEPKRVVKDEDLGPLVATDLTRCIQCTRCVRFGQEIAGLRELGAVGRGERLEIRTFIQQNLTSEISANIIDLCPVGALTSKPFRFTARPWELTQHASIAAHDGLGSHIYIHTRNGQVMRVVPHENEALNETWLSDRDRFSYLGLNHSERLLKPMIKRHDQWQETDWPTALHHVAEMFKQVVSQQGGLAALASPSSTTEEAYLLHKIWHHVHSDRIDHRLKQQAHGIDNNAVTATALKITDLENCHSALLIGSHVHHDLPLAATRLRKAALQGATIHAINPMAYSYHFPMGEHIVCHSDALSLELAGVIQAVLNLTEQNVPMAWFKNHQPTDAQLSIAKTLVEPSSTAKVIVLGQYGVHHAQAGLLRDLVNLLCHLTQAQAFFIEDGANDLGHRLAAQTLGAQPRPYSQWHSESAQAYLMLHCEPDVDCAHSDALLAQLDQAACVVAISAFHSEALLKHATVLLPAAAFTETSGSFFNLEGTCQAFSASVTAPGDSRPAWKILRVLANLLAVPECDYNSSEDIRALIEQHVHAQPVNRSLPATETLWPRVEQGLSAVQVNPGLTVLSDWPIYRIDALLRRASALQESASQAPLAIYANAYTQTQWQLGPHLDVDGNTIPVLTDERLTDHSVFVPAGYPQSQAIRSKLAAFHSLSQGSL